MPGRRRPTYLRPMAESTINVPVLIVGAGPVGLSAALALSHAGVASLVVERRLTISPQPRARFVNARTMEIFRRLGVENEIRAAAIPDGIAGDVVWAPSLSAPEVRRVAIETFGPASGEPLSPAPGVCTSQDLLDPILHRAVLASGHGEVRFGSRVAKLEQTADGVLATCEEDAGKAHTKVRAAYVIGADGAHSTVREFAGIAMQGPAVLGNTINIHFRADLSLALRGRSINMAMILNPAQPGLLLNIDGDRTWTAQAIFMPAAGQRPEDFTVERCVQVVRTQVGLADLEVEILGIAPWSSAARVAERFSAGTVFLAGDSAQEMPPAGGFGMNTGIQEADNLAWKLAAGLAGQAGPGLLATYDVERRPVADWVTQQAFENLKSVGRSEAIDGGAPQVRLGRPEFFRERGMVFGAAYQSSAVVADGTDLPAVANPVTDYLPSARPGARAPHVWIEVEGRRTSTLDLFGRGFTLLIAGVDTPLKAAMNSGVGVLPVTVVECDDPRLAAAYGLEPGGAVLVRPDGYVGWRSAATPTAAGVVAALESILDQQGRHKASGVRTLTTVP
ncbi:MAG: FAD-dependent oxidoreductase [Candidatus Dormibacteraceae bacterium]